MAEIDFKTFTGLSDTPNGLGVFNDVLRVNASGDALEFTNSPFFFEMSASGHVAIGSEASVQTNIIINVAESGAGTEDFTALNFAYVHQNNSDDVNVKGVRAAVQAIPTGSGTTPILIAFEALAVRGGSGVTDDMTGFHSKLTTLGSTGTLTNMMGFHAPSPTFFTLAPVNSFGVRIGNWGTAGTTVSKALSIEAQTGSTTNWAIASDGGDSYHIGGIHIGSATAPAGALEVDGTGQFNLRLFIGNNDLDFSNSTTLHVSDANSSTTGTEFGAAFDIIPIHTSGAPDERIACGSSMVYFASADTVRITSQRALIFMGGVAGSVTTSARAFFVNLTTDAAYTGTIAKYFGLEIGTPDLSGTKPTNMTGVMIRNQGAAGVTLNRGLHIQPQTGATTNWAIAADGGDSYHVGDFRFGSSVAPTATVDITGSFKVSGNWGLNGVGAGATQTGYTAFGNLTTVRTLDADSTTVAEIADVLGTLIGDLKTKGVLSA